MIEAIGFLAYEAFGDAGVDIIVDDLSFFGEPMFADGPVADAAQQATADGAVLLTAIDGEAIPGAGGFPILSLARQLPPLTRPVSPPW